MKTEQGLAELAGEAVRLTRSLVAAIESQNCTAQASFGALLPLLAVCAVDGMRMSEEEFVLAARSLFRSAQQRSARLMEAVYHA